MTGPAQPGHRGLREQLDERHSLASADRIIGLEDELADAHDVITGFRARLGEGDR